MIEIGTGDIVQNTSTGTIGKVIDFVVFYGSDSRYMAPSIYLTVDCGSMRYTKSPIELWNPVIERELLVGDKVRHITLDMIGIVKQKYKNHDMGLIYLEVEIDEGGGCYLGAPENHWRLWRSNE